MTVDGTATLQGSGCRHWQMMTGAQLTASDRSSGSVVGMVGARTTRGCYGSLATVMDLHVRWFGSWTAGGQEEDGAAPSRPHRLRLRCDLCHCLLQRPPVTEAAGGADASSAAGGAELSEDEGAATGGHGNDAGRHAQPTLSLLPAAVEHRKHTGQQPQRVQPHAARWRRCSRDRTVCCVGGGVAHRRCVDELNGEAEGG